MDLLEIKQLELPEDIYTRARGSPWWANVHAYAEEMKAGAKFPPIEVGRLNDRLIVVDGYHRTEAHKRLGIEYIQANVKTYTNVKDIIYDSVKANNHHGVRYTPQDKAHIAKLLGVYGFDEEEISALVKVPVDKLNKFTVKNFSDKTLKEPLMKLVNKGVLTIQEAYEVDQGRFSTQSLDDVLVQLINYLEFGAYPWGVEKYDAYASRLSGLLQQPLTIQQ